MSRAWIKLYKSWYGSMSHCELNGYAYHMGPWLLTLAGNDPCWKENGFAYVSDGKGSRLDLFSIGKRSRFTLNQTRKGIESLVDSGTICADGDGHYYFPKYLKWQEDSSTRRKRNQRAKSVNVTGEAEAEAEAEAEVIIRGAESAPKCAPEVVKSGPGSSGRIHHLSMLGRAAAGVAGGSVGRLTETSSLDDIVDHHGMDLVEWVTERVAEEVAQGRESGATWGLLFGRDGKVFEVMREKLQKRQKTVVAELSESEATERYKSTGEVPAGYVLTQSGRVVRL